MSEPHVRIRLGGEQYALPVSCVREVAELVDPTPVPGAPPSVLGVCNLRGQVLPVIDPALLVQASGSGSGPITHLVVAEGATRRAGLAVSGVIGVDLLPETEPATGNPHVTSAALVDGELVGILELDGLLTAAQASS